MSRGTTSGAVAAVMLAAALAAAPAPAALPDDRQYEIVSPGFAKGGEGVSKKGVVISPDGRRVGYRALNAFAGDATHAMATVDAIGYLATRGPEGWRSTFMARDLPQPDPAMQDGKMAFATGWAGSSADLTRHFFATEYGPDTGLQSGFWSTDGVNAPELLVAASLQFSAALTSSDDGRHLVVRSTVPLAPMTCAPEPCTPPSSFGQLLYEVVDGEVRLVNVDDQGNLLSEVGATFASMKRTAFTNRRNAISDDGSRIFFASGAPRRLYVRIDGRRTVEVSASEHSEPQPPSPDAHFVGASADGTRVFFTSAAALTDAADAGTGPFLYRYDLPRGASEGSLSLVAGVDHPVTLLAENAEDTEAVPNAIVSDDGSRVYYHSPIDGGSIFRSDADAGETELVTPGVGTVALAQVESASAGTLSPAELTPDGRTLLFSSTSGVVGGNTGRQLYLYDEASDALSRVSTGPTAPQSSFDAVTVSYGDNGETQSIAMALDNRYLSADGQYVFFASPAPLVAQDVNGRWDVYRYKRGEGVALISDGVSADDAVVLGGSPDGESVFFNTSAALVPQDGDGWRDIYAARVNGGFAAPAAGAPCRDDECQGLPSGAPSPSRSTSDLAPGIGDPLPSRRATLSLAALTARQRAALAAGGRVRVAVRVNKAGRVLLVGRAALGGRSSVVGRAAISARRAGVYRLSFRLSSRARRHLRNAGKLRLALSARFAGGQARKNTLTLTRPAPARDGR